VFLALSILLGWQTYLLLTGQGTIDAMGGSSKPTAAGSRCEVLCLGRGYDSGDAGCHTRTPVPTLTSPPPLLPHVSLYHLGALANFREAFDAHGALWWITWMLPSRRRKRGNGYRLPRRARPEAGGGGSRNGAPAAAGAGMAAGAGVAC
jgi:hypothetical protein